MGGAGRSGDGLRMVGRVSVGGAGRSAWDELGMISRVIVSRVCVYVDWRGGLVWEGLGCVGFVYKIIEVTAASSNNGGWALMYGTE